LGKTWGERERRVLLSGSKDRWAWQERCLWRDVPAFGGWTYQHSAGLNGPGRQFPLLSRHVEQRRISMHGSRRFFSLFFCISLLTTAPNRYLGQHRISLSVFVRVGCFFQSTATRRLFALTVWNLVCLDGGMGWLRYRIVIGCPAFSSLPWVLARRCCKYVGQAMLQNPSAWPSRPRWVMVARSCQEAG